MKIKHHTIGKGINKTLAKSESKMDNPEKSATEGT